jgi:hypothetical protein
MGANATHDVFVSYSRADSRQAADIDALLRARGLNPFFDRRNLSAGLPWVRALEAAIDASRAVIVLIGPGGFGNTQQYERELALFRQSRDPTFPVVPVLLPGVLDPPFTFLQVLTWIDLSQVEKVSDAPLELEHLVAAVRGGVASAEIRDAICPYRGLDAFREEDSAFFFGRGSADDPKSAIGELVLKVHDYPFVMVVGRSGSGKSSLVNAGLLPALRRERNRFWNALSLRPGPAPLRALAAAFNPRTNEGAAEYAAKITTEAERLRSGDSELLSHMISEELARAEGKPDRLLLYVDQWEELYTQGSSSSDMQRAAQHAADVNRFIDLMLTSARCAPVTVVGTVRADFYDPLIAHQEIRTLLPTRQVLLGGMPRVELERTILDPARKVGLAFDPPDLVQRMLDEAGEDEGTLPLLQYALKETWALRKGNAMTADSYARSGGVREAIRITAERAFAALSADDQRVARQLFLRMVTPGEGQEDTRARAEMPVEPAQLKIVEQFAGPRTRLLVTGWDRARRPTVEVAHEALIRTWPRLRGWIDANREKLRARAAVLQAKADWDQSGRRDDMLLPAGLQLERARTLASDPGDIPIDDIGEFIRLSSQREETALKQVADAQYKRIRNRTIALAGASSLAVLAILLGLLAEQERRNAELQRIEALDQGKQAAEILAGATKMFLAPMESGNQADFFEKGRELFQKGAMRGDDLSMYMLASFASISFMGRTPDYAEARRWFELAAAKGNSAAMNQLGGLYENGNGLPQDYATAHHWYELAADKGNRDAMNQLGWFYQNGWDVPQDYAKALEWYGKASDNGNSQGTRNLGWLYQHGLGVPQDYTTAREWYEKAAGRGNGQATSDVGFFYQFGWGVPQDYAKAREWFEKASQKGDNTGMTQLGWLYQNGWGVAQDYGKAREWYEKAADIGNVAAVANLGVLYEQGLGVPQDYAKARDLYEKAANKGNFVGMNQLGWFAQNGLGEPKDYAKARAWYEKAIEGGNAVSLGNLANLYEQGWGVPQDYAKARDLYEKAADQGNFISMNELGRFAENGFGGPKDYAKARAWYEKAGQSGNVIALANLGNLYEQGWGVPQDYAKAREWYEKAAEGGNATASVNLGNLYEQGSGVPQDYAKAREWYEKAAEKGDGNGMNNVGWLYENGWGVPQDYNSARAWYEKAAKAGSTTAMINLGELYDSGNGVPKDHAKAREWFKKAAEDGDDSAQAKLDEPSIKQLAEAGNYPEALRQQEALAAKVEAGETRRNGKPGEATAGALTDAAWYALLAKDFTKALTIAERAHSIVPGDLSVETNRAHALMFLHRGEEAREVYLAHRGKPIAEQDNKLWERVIVDNFAELRDAGLADPMMAQIEKQLSVSR